MCNKHLSRCCVLCVLYVFLLHSLTKWRPADHSDSLPRVSGLIVVSISGRRAVWRCRVGKGKAGVGLLTSTCQLVTNCSCFFNVMKNIFFCC